MPAFIMLPPDGAGKATRAIRVADPDVTTGSDPGFAWAQGAVLLDPAGAAVAPATDAVLLRAVQALERAAVATPARALQYARDTGDRMRVVVDAAVASVGTTTVTTMWGAGNSVPVWYGQGAPSAMDARETQREMTLQTYQGQRARWSFT